MGAELKLGQIYIDDRNWYRRIDLLSDSELGPYLYYTYYLSKDHKGVTGNGCTVASFKAWISKTNSRLVGSVDFNLPYEVRFKKEIETAEKNRKQSYKDYLHSREFYSRIERVRSLIQKLDATIYPFQIEGYTFHSISNIKNANKLKKKRDKILEELRNVTR